MAVEKAVFWSSPFQKRGVVTTVPGLMWWNISGSLLYGDGAALDLKTSVQCPHSRDTSPPSMIWHTSSEKVRIHHLGIHGVGRRTPY